MLLLAQFLASSGEILGGSRENQHFDEPVLNPSRQPYGMRQLQPLRHSPARHRVQILEFHRDLAEMQGEFSGGLISRHARTSFRPVHVASFAK
jgi:hypothetical protein